MDAFRTYNSVLNETEFTEESMLFQLDKYVFFFFSFSDA
jgi:hypothetical protein